MEQADHDNSVGKLNQGQRDCLLLVAQLMSSKEIARVLGISPNTADNRLKRAQAILGVNTRADAAKLLMADTSLTSGFVAADCGTLVDQSQVLARSRYARNVAEAGHGMEAVSGGGIFEDSGVSYRPTSFAFETPAQSWLSLFAAGELENRLTLLPRLALIMLMMIGLVICMAVLVVMAEGFSRLS